MRVLVAGGDGFIGKHVCTQLKKEEIDFDVVDLKRGTDICETYASEYDSVILLAASLERDRAMYLHNLEIYKWLAGQQVPNTHFVYASSAAVYADGGPSMERQTPAPPTLYGESKLLGECILRATQDRYTILRLSNVFGDGEGNGAIDCFKRGETTIYGDGMDVRDYIDVQTVAHAFINAALNPDKYRNQIYNISTGVPTTTLTAFRQYGKGEPVHLDAREFDTRYSLLINTKAIDEGLIV